jgi:hypothetical protein
MWQEYVLDIEIIYRLFITETSQGSTPILRQNKFTTVRRLVLRTYFYVNMHKKL